LKYREQESGLYEFCSEFLILQMEIFFTDYPDAGAGKAARNQALDHVRKNIKWLSKHKKTVEDWLHAV
jgi:glutamyl aminopeptidase